MMPPELVGEPMELEGLYDSVNVIMSLQVGNGLYCLRLQILMHRFDIGKESS